jgi:hypothetical protein
MAQDEARGKGVGAMTKEDRTMSDYYHCGACGGKPRTEWVSGPWIPGEAVATVHCDACGTSIDYGFFPIEEAFRLMADVATEEAREIVMGPWGPSDE